LFVHDTPLLRKSSAYEVSQSTVTRGKFELLEPAQTSILAWL
jgi:hypothetical protein